GMAERLPQSSSRKEEYIPERVESRPHRSQPSGSQPPSRPAGPESRERPMAASSASAAPAAASEDDRRVVRNESGVIVAAAPQRSEPKIVGFIQLADRRRPQQVIITDASSEENRGGRASQRK